MSLPSRSKEINCPNCGIRVVIVPNEEQTCPNCGKTLVRPQRSTDTYRQ